jgi:hypothetical protein
LPSTMEEETTGAAGFAKNENPSAILLVDKVNAVIEIANAIIFLIMEAPLSEDLL